ncbi:MAG: UDP-glucose 4-epimerase GalE [Alphaproteobacteria bacterium]|nr:UDP-glucose 4-epimerase GalE [Alphaproteobacteria bacterium]
MDSVLVTGGAGYIGSHACKALRRAGYLPVAFDDLSGGHAGAVQWGPLVRASLLDGDAVSAAIAEHAPVAVMHFAGVIAVGESMHDPGRHYVRNVAASAILLRAMQQAGVDAMVFSSSAAVYGEAVTETILESARLAPLSPYARSKVMVERMLEDFSVAHGMRAVSLRYFNAAGADADGDTGEGHEPETHLVPLAIRAALGRAPALAVFGDDYGTPDGTCLRDYIHVTDLAEAHVRALERLRVGALPPCLNLGAGRGASVREVIATVGLICGREVPFTVAPRRPGDAPRLVADISLARDTLGWTPRHSSLDEIVRTARAWEEKAG